VTPDVNVLLAAARADHPHHAPARAWLESALANAAGGEPFTLQPMVAASFLRLVTHPRVFVDPTSSEAALGFVEALLAAPGVVRPPVGEEWPILRRLVAEKGLVANDLPDAWLAAAVLHQGEHLATFDRDFRRLLPRGRFTRLRP
jgi:toxin-antitoxin system PIN domain toxin